MPSTGPFETFLDAILDHGTDGFLHLLGAIAKSSSNLFCVVRRCGNHQLCGFCRGGSRCLGRISKASSYELWRNSLFQQHLLFKDMDAAERWTNKYETRQAVDKSAATFETSRVAGDEDSGATIGVHAKDNGVGPALRFCFLSEALKLLLRHL